MTPDLIEQSLETKMCGAAIARPTIAAFLDARRRVALGDRGMIPEDEIEPVPALTRLDELPQDVGTDDRARLRELAVIKLNGGLGTGMGLDRTKSLIPVKGTDTFLDFIVRQILHLRGQAGDAVRTPAFYLMNSFSTRQETLGFLQRYPELQDPEGLDFLQSMVPKLEAGTLAPVVWPAAPDLEWCPPGHGDFYPSIEASGLLDRLLARGIKYAFVSNSDNLGATVDLTILRHVAERNLSFLMEVAERTPADRKGGHLARRRATGRLLLRESAQCPKGQEEQFQDIERHRYFNTNNLWIRLDHLRTELDRRGTSLPLPLITNLKTVDPRDPRSPQVIQIESAMGAAIECFQSTNALVVPRTRFAPVKATNDLLVLRSDACTVTPDHRLALIPERRGQPPVVELDPAHYKVLAQFDRLVDDAVPSLAACDELRVTGAIRFAPGVVCEGKVALVNRTAEVKQVAPGRYRDGQWEL